MLFFAAALCAGLGLAGSATALEVPPLNAAINDYAKMMPRVSIQDLDERLKQFRGQSGDNVVVLTMPGLEGEDIENFGRKAFQRLPLSAAELQKTVLLIVARKEQRVSGQIGAGLRGKFSEPQTRQKLQAQVEPYFNGMRPDLGIHAGVHFIFGVIEGEFRIDRATEAEQLENASKRGGGAGAIFAVLLAPYMAFVAGMLWGIYATHYGVHRETRLFMGAVLGGGTSKLVAALMAMISAYSDGLWYFIMAVSIPLGIFGSLTEYWMAGEWSGIPRIKDKVKRKPEDNMGI